tara:strand:- start:49 stop:348 length:300 start_codon:yes stop_codon:yes gene_type:complete
MTTLRTPPVSKLGIQLQNYRADRPDEWTMDEFTRSAEATALRIKELELALCEISNMCIGNLTISYSIDPDYVGQLIYSATGMTNPELNEHISAIEDKEL